MTSVGAYWLQQSHLIIDSGYNQAINNYTAQKERFIKQLEQRSGQQVNDFIEQLNNTIAYETLDELESTFEKAYAGIADAIGSYIGGLVIGEDASYDELITRFDTLITKQAQGKVDPKNLYHNLTKDLEQFLLQHNITKTGISQYVNSLIPTFNVKNIDIQNNLFGFARLALLDQLQNIDLQSKMQSYKTALKGYYKEELLVFALRQTLEKYDLTARQMGSITNEKDVQIKYDIGIGVSDINSLSDNSLLNLSNRLEAFNVLVTTENFIQTLDIPLLGTLQSKSWVLPWSKRSRDGNRKFLSFGKNVSLLPKGENIHYWHAGLYNVMSNLMQAIGINNFIFSTGDTVYWTADLLTEFKEHQYVLAFYWSKKNESLTSDIVATEHKDKF